MDRFDAIEAFVAVSEQQGFAPAARQLGLSTSAITRHVASLEERLGVRLLNRTTRAVSLTDAGHRFLERARRILADLDEAEQMAESERGEPSGRLVVTAPQIFGRFHVAPLICDLMIRYPRLAAELQLSDRRVNLVEDGVDAAIRIGQLRDSSEIARRVGAVRRVLVASPDYLAAHGAPQVPADLSGHQLIAFESFAGPHTWRFWQDNEALDVAVTPRLVTNSADAAITCAERVGGLTLVLSYQVATHVREGRLQVVMPDFEPPPLPVHIVYPSSRLLSIKVRALIEAVTSSRNWDFTNLSD